MSDWLQELLPEKAATEGLTPAVLQEYVDCLTIRAAQVRKALCQRALLDVELAKQHSDSADAITVAPENGGDAAGCGLGSGMELQYLEGLATMRGLGSGAQASEDVYVAKKAMEYRMATQELQQVAAALKTLRSTAALQQRLQTLDRHLAAAQYREAACLAVELSADCRNPEGAAQQTDAQGPEWGALTAAVQQRQQALEAAITVALAQAVAVEPGAVTVQSPQSLSSVWDGLQTLGLTDTALRELCNNLHAQVVAPLLEQRCKAVTLAGPNGATRLQLQRLDASGPGPWRGEAPLLAVAVFLTQHVLQGATALVEAAGSSFWPAAAASYCQHCLQPALPRDDAGIDAFERVANSAEALEAQVVNLGLWPASTAGPLHVAVKDALDRFLHSKRAKIVTRARQLLSTISLDTVLVGLRLPDDSNAKVAESAGAADSSRMNGQLDGGSLGGHAHSNGEYPSSNFWNPDTSVLAAGQYQVSARTPAVQALMCEALQQAVSSQSPSIAQSMCQAVADIATLATVLPTTLQAREISQVPHFAAVFHNDCLYLGDSLAVQPFAVQGPLRALLGGNPCFVEAVQSLRNQGKAQLKRTMDRQLHEILQLLEAAGGLQQVGSAQKGIALRKALQQILHSFRQVATAVGNVLSQRDMLPVAALLLAGVCNRLAGDILALPDISAQESEDLPRMLQPFVDEAPLALVCGVQGPSAGPKKGAKPVGRESKDDRVAAPDAEQGSHLGVDLLRASLVQRTAAYSRLKSMLGMMTAPLATIGQQWQAGELQQGGISRQDAQVLVKLLFQRTDNREKVLNIIRLE